MYILTYLDTKLLVEMEVEVTLEWQVVSITLVELTTVILHIACIGQPFLHVLALLLRLDAIDFLKLHFVNFIISRDVNQVVASAVITIDITLVQQRIRRTTLTLIDKTYSSSKEFLWSPVKMIEG